MKSPLDHLYECAGVQRRLQLNCYRYILETYYENTAHPKPFLRLLLGLRKASSRSSLQMSFGCLMTTASLCWLGLRFSASIRPKQDSYAGGCHTEALRATLAHGAAKGWPFASTDIRNAVILAPIKDEEEPDEEDVVRGLFPPKVFRLADVQYSCQGEVSRSASTRGSVQGGGEALVLEATSTQPEKAVAYMNVYVDDILYVGDRSAVVALRESRSGRPLRCHGRQGMIASGFWASRLDCFKEGA